MPTIAVTGLNATDNPAPGVAVARALREGGEPVRIVGLAYDLLDSGNYAPEWFDDVFLIPYPSQGTEALEARLRHIHATVGLDAVIPTLDSELPGFMALVDVLDELGIGAFMPTREQLDLRSKVHLDDLGRTADLPTPDLVVLADARELYDIHERIPYPFVVKGPFYGAKVAHTLDEALAAFHHMLAKWGAPVLVQAFVRGEEIDIAAVGDGRGGTLGAVAMKKTLLTDKGKGWAGVCIRDPEAMDLARRFFAASRWKGPCEVEVMRDKQGQYQLLEINPRFPAWIYMSVGAGANLPWLVAESALGRAPSPLGEAIPGTMFVRISIDQIARLEDYGALATTGELVDRDHRFSETS